MCFEGKWLQNWLRADKNKLRSLLVVDIEGHQRGGICIVPKSMVKHSTEKMNNESQFFLLLCVNIFYVHHQCDSRLRKLLL